MNKNTCHMTRCRKRREAQEKAHKKKIAQDNRLKEDTHKARSLDLWGKQK